MTKKKKKDLKTYILIFISFIQYVNHSPVAKNFRNFLSYRLHHVMIKSQKVEQIMYKHCVQGPVVQN